MKKVPFPKEIKAERIVLKAYSSNNIDVEAQTMFNVIDRNREFFIPWHKDTTGKIKYQNPDMCKEYIQRLVKAFEELRQAGYGIYKDNVYIAHINAFDIDYQNNSLEFGVFCDKDFCKNGYVSEAISYLEKIFAKQGAHHFTIKCANDNEASKKLAEKSGYTLEGIQKENRMYIGDNKYRDTFIFGKIIENQY